MIPSARQPNWLLDYVSSAAHLLRSMPHLCDEVLRLPQEAMDGLHTLALGQVPAAAAAAAAMNSLSCMTDATKAT
jgi:hypothetical protein